MKVTKDGGVVSKECPDTENHYAKFHTQDDATQQVETWQQATDPNWTKNLVFLAAGYTRGEKALFMAKVKDCYRFLSGMSYDKSGHTIPLSVAPWNRYMPLLNVYSVFQPSDISGALPTAEQQAAGITNNLDCTYGALQQGIYAIQCNMEKIRKLAQAAPGRPDKQLAIILVNAVDDDPPALQAFPTLLPRTVILYSGELMMPLLLRGLGLADADLYPEYILDPPLRSSLADVESVNCARSPHALHWSYWQALGPPLGLRSDAVQGCSFQDFYRPSENCIMQDISHSAFCPLCAESAIAGLYRDIQDLASPRCPGQNETLVITDADEDHYLFINSKFLEGPPPMANESSARLDPGGITATWTFPDGTQQNGAVVVVNGARLGIAKKEPYFIELLIVDASKFVREVPPPVGSTAFTFTQYQLLRKHMVFTTNFRVRVVSQADPVFGHCSVTRLSSFSSPTDAPFLSTCPIRSPLTSRTSLYCAICDPGYNCSNPTNMVAPSKILSSSTVWSPIEPWLTLPSLLLVWFAVAVCVAVWLHDKFRSISLVLTIPHEVHRLQVAHVVTSLLCTASSLSAIIVLMFVLHEQPPFRKVYHILTIVAASSLYLLSLLSITATVKKSTWLLLAGIVFLSLLALLTLILTSAVWATGLSLADHQEEMEQTWVAHAIRYPQVICAFQQHLQCSGYHLPCNMVQHAECPEGCLEANSFARPCSTLVYAHIVQYFGVMAGWVMALLILASAELVLQTVLWLQLRRTITSSLARLMQSQSATPQLTRPIMALLNLSAEERDKWRLQCQKHNKNVQSALGVTTFFQKTLALELKMEEVDALVALCDSNGDGRINMLELLELAVHPDLELGHPAVQRFNKVYAQQLLTDFHTLDPNHVGWILITHCMPYFKQRYGKRPAAIEIDTLLESLGTRGRLQLTFPEFAHLVEELDTQHATTSSGRLAPADCVPLPTNPPEGAECPGCHTSGTAGRFCSYACYEAMINGRSPALVAEQFDENPATVCPGCGAVAETGKFCSYKCYEDFCILRAQKRGCRFRSTQVEPAVNTFMRPPPSPVLSPISPSGCESFAASSPACQAMGLLPRRPLADDPNNSVVNTQNASSACPSAVLSLTQEQAPLIS